MNRTLLPILLIAVSIAIFFFWINPQYADVQVLNAQSDESNTALARVAELESIKSDLVSKENLFQQSDLTKLQKLLPDNVDNIRLFLDMQGIAMSYGTSIQDISVADQSQKTSIQAIGPSSKQYGQMALSFSVNISYEKLGLFLKDLENSLRVVEVKSLSFTADNKTPNLYKVSFSLNAFWLNPKTPTTLISQ